jgi:tRNA threonylcarbamoyladenosine biosynthesis protein TsaE
LALFLTEEEVIGEEGTEQLGQKIAALLQAGDVLALYGELGAGKTCLVRGLAKGLGVDERLVASPSFSLINEYPGPLPVVHIDCYRLHLEEELDELGLEEYFDGPGVTVIEWAERISDLPDDRLEITFRLQDDTCRQIRIEACGELEERFKVHGTRRKV